MAASVVSCALLAPACQPLALGYNHDGSTPSLLSLPLGSCEASGPGEAPRLSPFIPAAPRGEPVAGLGATWSPRHRRGGAYTRMDMELYGPMASRLAWKGA